MTLNLYALLRLEFPTGTITVDRMAFGDWQRGGWMAVQPSRVNAPGAAFLLDDLTMPAVTRSGRPDVAWSTQDPSGISGYSVILDQKPGTYAAGAKPGTGDAAHLRPARQRRLVGPCAGARRGGQLERAGSLPAHRGHARAPGRLAESSPRQNWGCLVLGTAARSRRKRH